MEIELYFDRPVCLPTGELFRAMQRAPSRCAEVRTTPFAATVLACRLVFGGISRFASRYKPGCAGISSNQYGPQGNMGRSSWRG